MQAERIYHLVDPDVWSANSDVPYRAASLVTEGFIHCSFEAQVAPTANLLFGEVKSLLVLHIDVGRLQSELRVEPIPTGESFPHVYGPINRDAVVNTTTLLRDEKSDWVFSARA